MPVHVGTSGWQYTSWREGFYPSGLPSRAWLEHYAGRFQTVEVNNAFYRLPDARVFAGWAARTPADFSMAVKASRYLTHVKRLRDPSEPVARLLERARFLGAKLGPILLQLPPSLEADVPRLRAALTCLPPEVRVAVEFRHESWYSAETKAVLEERRAVLCLADSPHRSTPLWRTADWGYLRLHEGLADPRPCYDAVALRAWVTRLAALWSPTADVFVYCNNDANTCAVRDAAVFAREAAAAGLQPTRVPDLNEVRLTA